ncbi:MAG TPA: gamma-glutamyl-gamma-aminobutyrate hydrolase family protein [Candidatus Dormibacteraeota bacterium]|jgi:CTP synthase (UTP-ammonia lyase)|nr:gamma-glutamyl-gamma-aminobutyrate hydrolase family protein [Candidatus Dormibacteraeota bacterium]
MRRAGLAIVGDREPGFDPHQATDAALRHTAAALGVRVEARWVPTETLADGVAAIEDDDGVLIAPGAYASFAGALRAIRHARERQVPMLGTCAGFQYVVIEYARSVLGFVDAEHAERKPDASNLFVTPLACSLVGQVLPIDIEPGSRVAAAYGALHAEERYYCNFGLAPEHRRLLHDGGLRVVATDRDGEVRALELPAHPFFVATLFVPQALSAPAHPHPLVSAFVEAATGGPNHTPRNGADESVHHRTP